MSIKKNDEELIDKMFDISDVKSSTGLYDPIYLPKDFSKMDDYIKNNKVELLLMMIDSIECGIKNKLDLVEVYKFEESDFIVSISKNEFKVNLENALEFFLKNEKFEYCTKVQQLIDKLTKKEKPRVKEKKKTESVVSRSSSSKRKRRKSK
jgi:hypothetical protein